MAAPHDPGWHPDPYGARAWRWWDGAAWSGETIPMMEDVARASGRWIAGVRADGGGAIELRDGDVVVGRLSWSTKWIYMGKRDVVLEAADGRWQSHDRIDGAGFRTSDLIEYTHNIEVVDVTGRGLDAFVKVTKRYWPVRGSTFQLPRGRALTWVEQHTTNVRPFLEPEERGEARDSGEWILVDEAGAPLVWSRLGGGYMGLSFVPALAGDPDRSLIVLLSALVVFNWWDSLKGMDTV